MCKLYMANPCKAIEETRAIDAPFELLACKLTRHFAKLQLISALVDDVIEEIEVDPTDRLSIPPLAEVARIVKSTRYHLITEKEEDCNIMNQLFKLGNNYMLLRHNSHLPC
ncbi:unnamed protein product [Soboliphyme baturini]|uniref:NPH3 domain-containing protein n=1 Tax=Soboliphyme baturini TaxID=241478 RepID=A0A183J784_9BILA|nr:unnamed protein product [Soboliphyme baturini]